MTDELVDRRFRKEIPVAHRSSMDTRIQWLWMQRFGTIQSVWKYSPDMLDRTAASLFVQAMAGSDLTSINTIFQRMEGGPQTDTEVLERSTVRL